jgi:hypothetical protein
MVVRREGVRRPTWLAEERWERLAPWSGVIGVALVILGAIIQGSADRPGEDASAQEVLTYFEGDQGAVIGGAFLAALGLLFLLWFFGSLRSRLAWSEGGVMRLASLAFAGGVTTVTLLLAAVAPEMAGAFAVEDEGVLEPAAAQALFEMGEGLFFLAWFPAAAMLAATAVVTLRTGTFPWWLGWVSLVMAVALLIPWIGWAVFLFLLPLWIILLSVWMWRWPERGVAERRVPPGSAAP